MKVSDYVVVVCDACLTASCWQGVFMCGQSRGAGVIEKKASELRKLDLEHKSWYSQERLLRICGEVRKSETHK